MRISDWSSDVCSSDLDDREVIDRVAGRDLRDRRELILDKADAREVLGRCLAVDLGTVRRHDRLVRPRRFCDEKHGDRQQSCAHAPAQMAMDAREERSEEHTSELQSLMRISYAVFCLKKKNQNRTQHHTEDRFYITLQTTWMIID